MNNRRMLMQTFGSNLFENAVAYYKLDETSGDAIDVVNGYNGTLFGGVTQGVNGKIGTAYSFDGDNDYIEIGNQSDFTFADANGDLPFSVGGWFMFDSFTSGMWLISKRQGNPTDREWQLLWRNGDLKFQTIEPDDTQGNDNLSGNFTTANLNTNQWYHIVGTYDGSQTKEGLNIYVDGVNVTNNRSGNNSLYTGMAATPSPVVIGYEGGWNDLYLNGKADECFINNTELTAGQISDLYNNGNGTTI